MKTLLPSARQRGFTLMETVIAIGVLSVLLTSFLIVFIPAADGIKKSISIQEADRLVSGLEQELVTLRGTQQTANFNTGFAKAYKWIEEAIKEAKSEKTALFVYQYRGSLTNNRPSDGTPAPVKDVRSGKPGEDYTVMPMVRRYDDDDDEDLDEDLLADLQAIEGGLYLVKCTQLVFEGGKLTLSKTPKIIDPKNPATPVTGPDDYPEAVIAFAAEFYSLPTKSKDYVNGAGFTKYFSSSAKPVFTRNLAVRR